MPDISALKGFVLTEILNEEPDRCRLTLLGTLPSGWSAEESQDQPLQAIIRIEKNAFASEQAVALFKDLVHKTKLMGSTDIYTWVAGWLSFQASDIKQPQGDVKINVICPATDVHVKKYTKQKSILVRETPELYRRITLPFINSFPPERTRWVAEILAGRAEQEKVLYSSSECVVLPDMKWDLHTTESLYLVAIAHDPVLRSLRDLRGDVHLDLLKSIRREAYRIVGERWNIGRGGLRMLIHYQPRFGMVVGQAHLLEDVISLLEVNPKIFETMTLTYGLGEQHGLYEQMKLTQSEVDD